MKKGKLLIVALLSTALLVSGCSAIDGFINGGSQQTQTSKLAALEVVTLPSKTHYQVNEDIDLTGLVLKATYEDNSTKTISNLTNSNLVKLENNKKYTASEGTKTVSVFYRESGVTLFASFNITVGDSVTPVTQYVVSFDSNGGSGAMTSQTINSGSSFTLPTCTFVAPTNQEFKAWQVGSDTTERAVGYAFTVTSNVVIKALWQNKTTPVDPVTTYTISFDSNGGTGSMSSVTKNAGATYALPTCGFTAPSGQEFKAWQIGTDTTERAVGYSFTVNSNVTIKALWQTKASTSKDAWTIMIYMCGSDLESGQDENGKFHPNSDDGGFATADIEEILSVSGQPNDVNIILETGGAGAWASKYSISSSNLTRYHVANKQLVKDTTLKNASMGSSDTFESFLEWGLNTYPAEKVGVILWNHGGALDGVCSDEIYNDELTDDEVIDAIQDAYSACHVSGKLEFIGYDACLMQVQDIAEFNSPYFNYMVASEESEAGTGWCYSTWVDDLYAKKSTTTILNAICDGFITEYDNTYGKYGEGYDNDQTLSVLDLSKVSTYKSAFETLAGQISSICNTSSKVNKFNSLMKTVKNYADTYLNSSDYSYYVNTLHYPSSWFTKDGSYYLLHGYYLFGTFDVYDFLVKLGADSTFSSLGSSVSNVKTALNQLVIKNSIGDEAGESHGLALVCPMSQYLVDYDSDYSNFSTWRSFVNNRGF